MNRARRSAIIIMSVIALAALSIPVLYYLEMRFSYHLAEVYMQDHAIPEDISFSSGRATDLRLNPTTDSIFYIACLPSEVSALRSLRLSFSHFRTLEIDGKTFRSGDEIYEYASSIKDEPVTMRLFAPRGELLYDGYVQFMFADSVPTMYLTTSENAIDIVDETAYEAAEKPHVGSTMMITAPDGSIDVVTDADIYRHGNTSFDYFDQKPYNLGLQNKMSLLGMTPGRKWVLKSNGQYTTVLMKNRAAFEIARQMGMDSAPESRYINLYINGRYMGLYLLCQNIQAPEFLAGTG
ncbi:MAG: CotH kinase family protein, partial [Lachnospiraceae bacterium]|nr:CotH kinase family protein [Lachnospiraceae bacterium]